MKDPVENLHTEMSITNSIVKGRIKIANPPSVEKEFEHLYYWIETQADTTGGRHLERVLIERKNNYLVCELKFGWLHGHEDQLLLEVAKEIGSTGGRLLIETDFEDIKNERKLLKKKHTKRAK